MLNFAKVAANSDGAKIRAYLTQDAPEPETLTVTGVSPNGRDLETGEKLTHYYTGRGETATWRADMPAKVAAALGIKDPRRAPRYAELDPLFEARRTDRATPGPLRSERIQASISSSPRISPSLSPPNSPQRRRK